MSITNSRVEANEARWIFAPKVYDFLKDAAQIYLPALGAAYASLAGIWGWGFVVEVLGTIVVVDTLLGALLKISKTVYDNSDKSKDGDLSLTVSRDGVSVSDVLMETPVSELANKDRIVLEVETEATTPGTDPRLLDNSQN